MTTGISRGTLLATANLLRKSSPSTSYLLPACTSAVCMYAAYADA